MTQRALILTQQTKRFEGRHVCHLCDARVRTHLPHKCRVPPIPFPPVKWCPKDSVVSTRVVSVHVFLHLQKTGTRAQKTERRTPKTGTREQTTERQYQKPE